MRGTLLSELMVYTVSHLYRASDLVQLQSRTLAFIVQSTYCLLNLHSTYLQPVLKVSLHRCSCSLDYLEVPGP